METGAGLGCAGSRLVSGDDYRVFHYGKLQTKKQVEICTGTWSWLRRHLLQINPFRTIIPHWQKGLASPDKNWRHWPNSGKCGEAETACFSGDIDDALGCSIFSFCEKKKKRIQRWGIDWGDHMFIQRPDVDNISVLFFLLSWKILTQRFVCVSFASSLVYFNSKKEDYVPLLQ